jgi:hypothetical protein
MVMLYDGAVAAPFGQNATPFRTNGGMAFGQSPNSPAIANGATIQTAGVGVARVNTGGAVTAVILQAGSMPGQFVTVVNEAAAANTVTFDVAGTSFVADGAGTALAGLTARSFVWDSVASRWFRLA